MAFDPLGHEALCVCVCVCEREKERERVRVCDRERERERERDIQSGVWGGPPIRVAFDPLGHEARNLYH